LQSSSRSRYAGRLSICFFYLNVGTEGHPSIARVEIPQWVADSPGMLSSVHGVLVEQCALLAVRPYPYILHRAHETAKVSVEEKEQIKLRVLLELRRNGVEPEGPSGKSSAKIVSETKRRS
jgi:hypothetical protein